MPHNTFRDHRRKKRGARSIREVSPRSGLAGFAARAISRGISLPGDHAPFLLPPRSARLFGESLKAFVQHLLPLDVEDIRKLFRARVREIEDRRHLKNLAAVVAALRQEARRACREPSDRAAPSPLIPQCGVVSRRFALLDRVSLFPVESLGLKPTSPNSGPTPKALAEQQRRLLTLAKIRLYVENGYGKCRAAGMAGVSIVAAWRWKKLYEAGGADALLPRPLGPRSQFQLDQAALDRVEALALTSGSRRKAWLRFARSAECPPELACQIRPRTGHVPESLLQRIPLRRVPAFVLLGPRHYTISLRWGKGGPR